MSDRNEAAGAAPKRRQPQKKRVRRDINGWLILDKPAGLTSTEALGAVKRLLHPMKAGHAGTLDPLATGVLPIALGEATKTVPFVVEGRKVYRFTVRWGVRTDTDDAEGEAIAQSDRRPTAAEVEAVLPEFTGEIMQVPPRFSAIKVKGERAYDLAREGESVELAARAIAVHRLALVGTPDADHAVFEAECGKGAYVRALARDLGERLGTEAHVCALRRLVVGPFDEADTVTLDELEEACAEDWQATLEEVLLPVHEGLAELPSIDVEKPGVARLRRGQSVLLRGQAALARAGGTVSAMHRGTLVALCEIERGELHPTRVFHARQAIPAVPRDADEIA